MENKSSKDAYDESDNKFNHKFCTNDKITVWI